MLAGVLVSDDELADSLLSATDDAVCDALDPEDPMLSSAGPSVTPMYVEEAGREVEAAAACVSAAGSSLLLCPEATEAVPPVLALSGVPCLADPSLDEALLLAASVDADVDAPLAGLPDGLAWNVPE